MTTKLDIKINQSIIMALGKKLYSSDYALVVVRELIQNSLDANATKIEIAYTSHTQTLRVTDNGTGIARIEGLLDTIGESDKPDSVETIGGFGIAKLAIFGTKEWKIVSQGGTFQTGFVFDESVTRKIGTEVTVVFDPADVNWIFETQIQNYIQMTDRNVVFEYNGRELPPHDTQEKIIGNFNFTTANTSQNGHMVVRINGLPSFSRWISNLKETIIVDYKVTVAPYDPAYPLSSNRDSFRKNTIEYSDLQEKIAVLQLALETEKKLSEMVSKDMRQVVWRGKKYIAAGNIKENDFDESSMTISTYERYVRQIGALSSYGLEKVNFGLTDQSDDELGLYQPSTNTFLISNQVKEKGKILAIAIHEYTHSMGYINHDQSFANTISYVTGLVLGAIYNGEFRK